MKSKEFDNLAGLFSILAGVSAFAYAVSFIIISRNDPAQGALLSALFLLLTGFFSTAPLVALYFRLKEEDKGFAFWALFLGIAGAFGMAIHGGYDLANSLNPPSQNIPSLLDLPSQIDPRGLLTFGVSGVALLTVHYLMSHRGALSKNLGYVAGISGILSLVLYIGRLVVLSPASPIILYPALINGFVISPLFYLWLGMILRGRR